MSKPDDDNREYDQARNRAFHKIMEALREVDPRTVAAHEGVAAALVDVMLTLILNLSTEPRTMADLVASSLKRAVDAKLGGTKH